jgi:hypothetical protein
MFTEDISELLSSIGFEFINRYGIIEYLNYFKRVVNKKLATNALTETAASVAIKRAEAIATCHFNNN